MVRLFTKDVKVAKLKDWAAENGLKLSQTIAMGDGANDLPMIKTAGIGIAFVPNQLSVHKLLIRSQNQICIRSLRSWMRWENSRDKRVPLDDSKGTLCV